MHPYGYPDGDEPNYQNAAMIRQLSTQILYERINLVLVLIHRYIYNGNLMAATYARYLARIGMELLDRKKRPHLQDERRFQTEKEIEFEQERVDIENYEKAGLWSPDEATVRRQELELAMKAYRIEQAKAYLKEWGDDADDTDDTD